MHTTDRFADVRDGFRKQFGKNPTAFFSSPGRTELGGNHTDHNRGRVLAATIDLDTVAAVGVKDGNAITVCSKGFDKPFVVDTGDVRMKPDEKGTSQALIRGIIGKLLSEGYRVGGFQAYMASRVAIGSGLSSSASFEVLIGCLVSELFNEGAILPLMIARAGKHAENDYFGKPCGLMDQLTCAVGGTIEIDFRDPENPDVEHLEFSPNDHGYALVVVNTGSSHSDLTNAYASIPNDMRSVAKFLGREYCRDIERDILLSRLDEVRRACGDRAVLRCLHFLDENERVEKQCAALRARQFKEFLRLVQQSGDSSMKWLQNSFSTKTPTEQPLVVAQALTDRFLSRVGGGAYRIHGGGFAGTIQAYIPTGHFDEYAHAMTKAFGKDSVARLMIRDSGVTSIHQLPPKADPPLTGTN